MHLMMEDVWFYHIFDKYNIIIDIIFSNPWLQMSDSSVW